MSTIIFKYGGKILNSKQGRKLIIDNIKIMNNQKIIIVASAPGRLGDPYATQTLLELFPRLMPFEKDQLISYGETIACYLLKNDFLEAGIAAEVVDNKNLGIITDDNYQDAKVIYLNNQKINQVLQKTSILIVPGFQGITEKGFITTLGRGGSDLTALLMAKMTNSGEVFLFKDVDGIYLDDPSSQNKRLIPQLSYQQMLYLCDKGINIVQDKAVIYGQLETIKIKIINYFTNQLGTTIGVEQSVGKIIFSRREHGKLILGGIFNNRDLENAIWKLQNSEIKFDSIVEKDGCMIVEGINEIDRVEQVLMDHLKY